jgi:hypothetical protein
MRSEVADCVPDGKLTSILSPPCGWGAAVTVAPWASPIALTMARPRPVPSGAARVRGEPLEGPEEEVDVGGRDRRAGVGDGQDGPPGLEAGGDVDASGGLVVADRVVDQVADQSLDQAGVAADRCRAGLGGYLDPEASGVELEAEQDVVDNG